MIYSIENKRVHFFLAIFDFLSLYLSFCFVYSYRFGIKNISLYKSILFSEYFIIILSLVILFNLIFDLYEIKYWINELFSPFRIALSLLFTIVTLSFIIYFSYSESKNIIGRGVLYGSLLSYFLLSLGFRWVVQAITKKISQNSLWLIVGSEEYKQEFLREYKRNKHKLNFIWEDLDKFRDKNQIYQLIKDKNIQYLVFCDKINDHIAELVLSVRQIGVNVFDFQYFHELLWGKVALKVLSPRWFLFRTNFNVIAQSTSRKVKRIMDFFVSLLAIIVLSPVFLIIAFIIRLDSKGGAFYKQKRVGLNNKEFTIFKFRSMVSTAEQSGAQWATKNDSRITRVGKFIRLTRLDELPQLFNIIKGEMSFVGPRPERPEFTSELEKKVPFYRLRHTVKPGLTGWAQVIYSYADDFDSSYEKLQYDLFYVKNRTIFLDLLIIFKTFIVVFFGKGR